MILRCGTIAVGLLAMGGAHAGALALPRAALAYITVMKYGGQLILGSEFEKTNDHMALKEIEDLTKKTNDMIITKVTDSIIPETKGLIKDIFLRIEDFFEKIMKTLKEIKEESPTCWVGTCESPNNAIGVCCDPLQYCIGDIKVVLYSDAISFTIYDFRDFVEGRFNRVRGCSICSFKFVTSRAPKSDTFEM